MQTLTQRLEFWLGVVAAFIIAVVSLLFGDNLVAKVQQSRAPRFTVSAKNMLETDQGMVYEVTPHLMVPTQGITLDWGLEVIPLYEGNRQYGEVQVLLKTARGYKDTLGQWDNLTKDSETLHLVLDASKLCQEIMQAPTYGKRVADLSAFQPVEVNFEIEIVKDQTVLQKDKLTIRLAPWYHYTATRFNVDGSVSLFVYGKNLGSRSDFTVETEIYEIAELPGWPWHGWPRVHSERVRLGEIAAGAPFTATFTFPRSALATPENQFALLPGKVYLANTYVMKKQNYLVFSDKNVATYPSWGLSSDFTQDVINLSSAASASILSIQEGDQVPHIVEVVKGTSQNLASDMDLWIYVYVPSERRYWCSLITERENDSWEFKNLVVGTDDPNEHGTAYVLGLLLANKEQSAKLSMTPAGIAFLPLGTTVMQEINVTRE